MFAGLKDLRETVSSFHTTITERLDGLDLRVAAIEDVLSRQRGPTTPNAGEVPTGVTTGENLHEATTGASPVDGTHGETTTCTAPEEGTTEEALVEATTGDSIAELDTSKGEARVELTVGEVLVEATTTHDDAPKPVIGSIERGVKARQIRKRKMVTSPFTHTYRKSRARTHDVVASTQAAEPAKEVSTDDAIKVDDPQAATVVVEEHQTEVSTDDAIKVNDPQAATVVVEEHQPEVSKNEPIEVDDPQTAIVVVEEHQSEASEALHVIKFSSRAILPKRMLDLIDTSCSRFKDKGDTVFVAGNIIIARGQIDELLTDQYLSDAHIDAFAFLLAEKCSLCPGLYEPYLYISCLHWSYARYGLKMESKMFIQHITADSVARTELILMPVIDNQHWTLLVGHIKSEAWSFYDSLPKPTHKSILPEIIKLLVEDAGQAFASDPRKWPIDIVSGIPVQENSVDCGMFVCKYMEAAISKPPVDWVDRQDWPKIMNIFRAEFAYATFCLGLKNPRK